MSERVEISGFSRYQVDQNGVVWSSVGGSHGHVAGQWFAMKTCRSGKYPAVRMKGDDGRMASRYIHRLVLEAFVGPCPPGMEGCHCDGNRENFLLSNLRWDTRKNNHADKARHGTNKTGEKCPLARLTHSAVSRIRLALASGESVRAIAERERVCTGTIRDVGSCKTWKVDEHGNALMPVYKSRNVLTPDAVREIRRRSLAGELGTSIAKSFGVDKGTVYCVLNGATWSHVT